MEFSRITAAESKSGSRRISPVMVLIVLFWLGQFGFLTLHRQLMILDYPDMAQDSVASLLPRFIMCIVGMAISLWIDRLHRRQGGRSWPRRVVIAIAIAAAGTVLHTIANFISFQLILPELNMRTFTIPSTIEAMIVWLWTYATISALLLAGAYSDELHERERRLVEWQGLAHSAQLRALRYQLNPHFMFNTLNSIASLIASGNAAPAEQMVENLSDFLRAGLALDPSDDLTLERELELQSLYLSIEAIRFADRLRIEMDLPAALRDVRVPSLILQPIVENAVKHGVARSDRPVTVSIAVREEGGRVRITVRNGVGQGTGDDGTGIGLANTARRLDLRYGERCDFSAGLDGADAFLVSFSVPMRSGEA